ncbi:MAG TPA: hypothetical protein VFO76_11590 [Candidatus Kapabacteria bacterium]|nr:hypothetical protein [Candidatus Kapabacteria bacterium]
MILSRKGLFLLFILLLPSFAIAQQRVIVHKPEVELTLLGLLRPFKPVLTKYIVEIHPGWLIKELFDSSKGVTTILCLDPADSMHLIMSLISYPYQGLDSIKWAASRQFLQTKYGDAGIGIKTLSDQDSITANPKNGILAVYEGLAKLPDHLEYLASVATTQEAILIRVPLSTDEYNDRISYFRKIIEDIKVKK